MVSPQISF